MNISPIVQYLLAKGYTDGWACNDVEGIVVWERDEPQPTEAELVAAGWIKPEPAEEASEE